MSTVFINSYGDSLDLAAYTFLSVPLGAANAARQIIVGVSSRGLGSGVTITGVTIGGVSATIVSQVENAMSNSNIAALAIASVPSGTTGDVVVTHSAGRLRCLVSVWSATGLVLPAHDTATATAAAMTGGSALLDLVAGGTLFAVCGNSNIVSGVTEDSELGIDSGNGFISSGHNDGTVAEVNHSVAFAPTGVTPGAAYAAVVCASFAVSAASAVAIQNILHTQSSGLG